MRGRHQKSPLGSIKKQVLTSAVSTTPRKRLWRTYLLAFYYNQRRSAYLLTYSSLCSELRTWRTYLLTRRYVTSGALGMLIYFFNTITTLIRRTYLLIRLPRGSPIPAGLIYLLKKFSEHPALSFCFCIEPSARHWRRCTPVNATVCIKRRWTLKDDKTNREKHAMSRIDVHWRSMMCICVPLRRTASHFGIWSAISYFGVPFSILTRQIIS